MEKQSKTKTKKPLTDAEKQFALVISHRILEGLCKTPENVIISNFHSGPLIDRKANVLSNAKKK